MARWNVYNSQPIDRLEAPDRNTALARAKERWGADVSVRSVAAEEAMRDDLSVVRRLRLPNRFTDYRGDEPPAA